MTFEARLTVRPRHCDAQGMLHAARYYEYFEEAFLQWLDACGVPYASLRASGIDLVIVENRCAYSQPARLDEILSVAVSASHVGKRAFGVAFDVSNESGEVASGASTYVTVSDGRSAPLPERFASLRLGDAPALPLTRRFAEQVLTRLHDAQRAFYAGDASPAALEEVLAPDVVWTIPGQNAIAGTYVGVEEVIRYMDRRRRIANNTFAMTRRDVMVGDEHVAALTDGSAVLHGRSVEWSTIGLYRLAGDRIAQCRLIPLDPHLFDQIWSDP